MVPTEYIWVVVVGFIAAFFLAFGMGANDVANSFGTSVGSRVLTLKQAFIIASVCETLGSVLLGSKVAETIRNGIINTEPYQDNPPELMLGNLSALIACCTWLIIASLLRLPVSGTQSIVGATLGFALVAHGLEGISWIEVIKIISSWFISPIFAGLVSTAVFFIAKTIVLDKDEPLEPGLKLIPYLYGVTITINVLSVVISGPEMLYFDHIPLWGRFIIAFGCGLICLVIVRVAVVPWLRRKIKDKISGVAKTKEDSPLVENAMGVRESYSAPSVVDEKKENAMQHLPLTERQSKESNELVSEDIGTKHLDDSDVSKLVTQKDSRVIKDSEKDDEKQKSAQKLVVTDKPEAVELFSFLQTLTATFASFVHGGNDVSNAIGPLVSLWLIAKSDKIVPEAPTPVWILVYGGLGISVGLCVLGSRVIQTLGDDLSQITPSSGFSIEIGSAFTVLLASNIGIPISTTHCLVGGIICVGYFRSKENVDWSLFRNIFLAWVVTLPLSGSISAALFAIFKAAYKF